MEIIKKYKACDGSEWNIEKECILREKTIIAVDAIMEILEPHPTECNWDGHVQQGKHGVDRCKRMLFNLVNVDGVLKWWIDKQKDKHGKTEQELIDCHPSWFLRMLDCSNRPIEIAYGRLSCIDENNREYNQPYYTTHQSEAKNICVNRKE